MRLYQEGVKVVAIPKTMDNDVPGTDYCIGFSTGVTRTIQMTNDLRTSAGSHERFLVLEVFGRYAGFTAMLPTMAGAANRCVIPEHQFDIEQLTELLVADRRKNPSHYSVVLVSEGAMFEGGEMVFEDDTTDAFGHKKLGGIGDLVSEKLKELSPEVQQRQSHRRDQPEAGIPGALRRSRCHRLDRAHGLRQSRARPAAEQDPRPAGGAEERPLRQHAGRCRNRLEESRECERALQHRPPAPALQQLRNEAAFHHDQRNLIGRCYTNGCTTVKPA